VSYRREKNVGPAFRDIAAAYKGQDVEDKLITKIKKVVVATGVYCQCLEMRGN